jgi:hypothetical protein
MAFGTNNDSRIFSGLLVAGYSRSTNRFLARGTMHQSSFHLWGDHQSLATTRTLVDIQRRGDGNRSMAVGALDGYASSSLIDNEVITAGLTFEEDIRHLLISGGATASI